MDWTNGSQSRIMRSLQDFYDNLGTKNLFLHGVCMLLLKISWCHHTDIPQRQSDYRMAVLQMLSIFNGYNHIFEHLYSQNILKAVPCQ